jgi:hypothetical protein
MENIFKIFLAVAGYFPGEQIEFFDNGRIHGESLLSS